MATNPAALKAVLTEATRKALTRQAIQVQNEARRRAPVATGTLRRSISYEIIGDDSRTMVARVGTNVEYALDVEQGTGLYGPHRTRVVPAQKKVMVFKMKGGPLVFASSTRGRKATPFLGPALRAAFGL